ncbi:hypothetical protein SAMN06265360_112170 [Haloechinothrix alba]|uniref:Uncharacterized protein n=1 Tax=Haloechinothrix alba TaxID=664784 RepID=A0A238XXK7_9PSEU|nr:hypothetical protein [Haloechinothrix alba]SNR63647.1 hypothetical protein SAMN06265360_112170 [Haloechinothrix alba]
MASATSGDEAEEGNAHGPGETGALIRVWADPASVVEVVTRLEQVVRVKG